MGLYTVRGCFSVFESIFLYFVTHNSVPINLLLAYFQEQQAVVFSKKILINRLKEIKSMTLNDYNVVLCQLHVLFAIYHQNIK